jgi:hypothetical protein
MQQLPEEEGVARARAKLLSYRCPECGKHKDMHNDEKCLMRFEEAEVCA